MACTTFELTCRKTASSLSPIPRKNFPSPPIFDAINKAGFDPDDMSIVADGEIEKK